MTNKHVIFIIIEKGFDVNKRPLVFVMPLHTRRDRHQTRTFVGQGYKEYSTYELYFTKSMKIAHLLASYADIFWARQMSHTRPF